jgi:DNA-binding transcriptional regulator LsrR (DeoR family)
MRLADMFGAECSYIAGPAFTDTEETRDLLMRQAMLVDAFEQARKADIAYISVGGMDEDASMIRLGLVSTHDIAALGRAGAVGDILGYWVDEDGEIVDHPINRRVLALPPGDLRQIPSVILVTGGAERYQVIRGVLRKGLVDILVTDETAAALVCGRPRHG